LADITISIVSHNQELILNNLLNKLAIYSASISKVIVTHNTLESNNSISNDFPFELEEIQNPKPKGFGSNHNQAFQLCTSPFFCIMNPDIDLDCEPFQVLQNCFSDSEVAVAAPSIKNLEGKFEDSARYFPTPFGIIRKLFFNYRGEYPIKNDEVIIYPDWVGGMFMLFESIKFNELGGFDERYHLYYEDVDLCLRTWKIGYKVLLTMETNATHDARRASHRKLIYFKWHIISLFRFFIKHIFRFPNKLL
jgi:N-acetylglucosaminyl-diphospho-decaprenol L-rhamnosyltransferase